MPAYTTEDIRNIALTGHSGAGKTTLTESLLHAAGVIGAAGSVEQGTTVSDHTDQEKQHGHSFVSSVVHADVQGKHINLIDTPGTADFIGQAIAAMPAVETVAVAIDAAAGILPATRWMMQRAEQRRLCRMIIINKIDSEHTDLPGLIEAIQAEFGKRCLPINLPARGGKAVVDCFFNPSGDSDFGSVEAAHTAIVDQVVEVDEALMALYLEQGEIKPEQLHAPFEKALREGHLVPICFTAARPHSSPEQPVGIAELLDVLVKLAPNPLEGNPRPFVRGSDLDHEIHAEPDPNKHVLAHVFNVRIDPFVGKLAAFRVHQGRVTAQSQLFVDNVEEGESKKPFKVGHLFKLQGKEHVEIDAAIPGDLAAVAKVDEIHFDAVLHDSHDEDNIHLRPLDFPEPMAALAISGKKRGDEQRIADALHKQLEEDPTFRVTRDATTHETVIHGLGELHLRVILEKLQQRDHLDFETHPPRIAYRETIQGKAEARYRHKKQTGGAGQFGEVQLRVEPMDRGAGFEFVNDTFGGSVPQQFIPAVEKGVRQGLEQGAIAGFPLQDIRVSLFDGKHHPVDSKEVAFVTAGKRAFLEAVSSAKPVLLEPMVSVEITAPSAQMGDLNSDLSAKRGRIVGTDMLPNDQVLIKAIVPLGEMTNYQGQLKSMTAGQGSFVMTLSHYDPVPHHVQEQIAAGYKPQEED